MGELSEYASARDLIIVGSDQVWNVEMIRRDSAYFLKFTSAEKKMSYAASIGLVKLSDEQKKFITRC